MDQSPKSTVKNPANSKANIWLIVSIILAIVLIAVLVNDWSKANQGSALKIITTDEAGTKLIDFVNTIYGAQLGTATLKETTEENGLYKVTVSLTDPTTGQPSDQPAYLTKDGELFIPQVIKIADALKQFEAFQQQLQQNPPEPTPESTSTDQNQPTE